MNELYSYQYLACTFIREIFDHNIFTFTQVELSVKQHMLAFKVILCLDSDQTHERLRTCRSQDASSCDRSWTKASKWFLLLIPNRPRAQELMKRSLKFLRLLEKADST